MVVLTRVLCLTTTPNSPATSREISQQIDAETPDGLGAIVRCRKSSVTAKIAGVLRVSPTTADKHVGNLGEYVQYLKIPGDPCDLRLAQC